MTRPDLPDSGVFRNAIAAELRAELARRNITQKQLGDAFDWGRNKVNKLLHGQTTWDPLELVNVCDYLSEHGDWVDYADLVATAKRKASLPAAESEDARTGS